MAYLQKLAGIFQQFQFRQQGFFFSGSESSGDDFIYLVIEQVKNALPFPLVAMEAGNFFW